MTGWVTIFLLWGLLAAALRLSYEWGRGDFRRPQTPHTTADIAKEGLQRAEQARDTSYRHFNRKVRS